MSEHATWGLWIPDIQKWLMTSEGRIITYWTQEAAAAHVHNESNYDRALEPRRIGSNGWPTRPDREVNITTEIRI